MSNTPDPLERELASLKPREPSPKLRRRVDAGLNDSRLGILIFAVMAGVFTGIVLLAFLLMDGSTMRTSSRRAPAAPTPPVTVPDESLPTLQAYRRAISRSPEDFEALLDKHAAASTESMTLTAKSRPESVSFGEH